MTITKKKKMEKKKKNVWKKNELESFFELNYQHVPLIETSVIRLEFAHCNNIR